MKKILSIIIAIIVIVLIGGATFYGGIKYAQSKALGKSNQGNLQNVRQMGGANAGAGFRNAGSGSSGFASGEIISKDNNSVTIKLQDGGSKIIFYSGTTEIDKFVQGTLSDLEIGKTVIVNGIANQDGSITSQSIQLRTVTAPATSAQ